MNYTTLFIQLLPETVLVLTALALLGIAVASESKHGKPMSTCAASWIAAAGVMVAFLTHAFATADYASASELLANDAMTHAFKAILLAVGLLVVLLPPARREIVNPGEYMALMLFALTGLLLTVGTTHLLFLFVALELASLSLYLLAGFSRTARSTEASLKYFLFGGVSAAFFLFGLSLIYGFSSAATLGELSDAIHAGGDLTLVMAGLAMVVVGIGFKLAVAPFHYWAPDVYQGAPAPTVAMVATASKLAGMVVLGRVLLAGFGAVSGSAEWGEMAAGWSLWIAVLAAVSIILGNVLAMAQSSVRRLLAYSAVANSGYLLVGVAAAGSQALGAALFYVVVYGLATLGALAVTAAVERHRGSDEVASFAGLIHRSPGQALALLVCFISLAGIPPLAGFAGKFVLFSSALAAQGVGLAWLVGLAVVMSAVSLYYYLKVLKQAFVADNAVEASVEELPLGHRLVIAIPAVALVVLGVLPALLLDPISEAVTAVLAGW